MRPQTNAIVDFPLEPKDVRDNFNQDCNTPKDKLDFGTVGLFAVVLGNSVCDEKQGG